MTAVEVRERLSRESLYMAMAHLFAQRSTCIRGQVGCVAVRANHIVAAGYNGAPPGMKHCLEVGCGGGVAVTKSGLELGHYGTNVVLEFPNGCTRAVHAEANMVAFAARHGIPLDKATVFSTHGPCLPCAQALVSAGIICLYYQKPYRLPEGLQLVDQANIGIVQWPEDS